MRLKPVSALVAVLSSLSIALVAACSPAVSAVPPHIKAASQPAPSWVNNATVYEVNVRQFSSAGTFNAVTDALARIKALGASVIWLMPVTPIGKINAKGTLGSPYSVANYTAVDPDYGTDADFTNLVNSAHSLGMKVVLDWVGDHSAWDNPWITQHPDWYVHDSKGNITWPVGTDWTDVAQLNYGNAGLHAAMIDAMKYWVTKFNIDGYRCDAAGMVPVSFWDEATAAVNQVKPLWWLAEDQANSGLLSQSFSSNYNWQLLSALNNVGNKSGILAAVMNSASYPAGTFPMNFITNHDENSWNGTEFERMGNAVQLSAAITYLTPGIPLLYNGQEVGLSHRLAFFEKDPIAWTANPAASTWTSFYTKLNKLRQNNKALWSGRAGGKLVTLTSGDSRVLAFGRSLSNNKVFGLFNMSALAKKLTLKLPSSLAGTFIRYSDGKKIAYKANTKVTISLAPWAFAVYSTAAAK